MDSDRYQDVHDLEEAMSGGRRRLPRTGSALIFSLAFLILALLLRFLESRS